ncbi:hypothetical protein ACS0TY_036219 [Phlomoides rotata]
MTGEINKKKFRIISPKFSTKTQGYGVVYTAAEKLGQNGIEIGENALTYLRLGSTNTAPLRSGRKLRDWRRKEIIIRKIKSFESVYSPEEPSILVSLISKKSCFSFLSEPPSPFYYV